MSGSVPTSTVRQRRAAEILAGLGLPLRDARLLSIHCANGHHVAAVYRTPEGAVIQAPQGRRSHGDRDFVDTPHRGGREPELRTDFLEAAPFGDDDLHAWCDCGPWTLSRQEISGWIAAEQRRVVLESKA